MKTIYHTLAYPHLLYGIILWGGVPKSKLNRIFLIQKKIIRSMTNSDYLAHTNPLFSELQIYKLDDIYYTEIAKFMFRSDKCLLPEPLSNIYTETTNIHSYNTRQISHIRPPAILKRLTQLSMLSSGPNIWNGIQFSIKQKPHIKAFSAALRLCILQGYLDSSE